MSARRDGMSRRTAFAFGLGALLGLAFWSVATERVGAVRHVAEAADLIEANAYYAARVDWPAARREAYRAAVLDPSARGRAVGRLLIALNDGHSQYRTAEEARQLARRGRQNQVPEPRRVGAHGVVAIGGYSGFDRGIQREYATEGQRRIAAVARDGACGWVVDLRHNLGGNMWPMLGSLGPLLGDGVVGYFIDRRGVRVGWSVAGGAVKAGEDTLYTIATPERLAALPPVAVLTSGNTASSGEAVTIAFRARPDTRSFGAPTSGLSTANGSFPLADGALLLIARSLMADRSGTAYGSTVHPDQPVARGVDRRLDAPLAAALAWLDGHPACR